MIRVRQFKNIGSRITCFHRVWLLITLDILRNPLFNDFVDNIDGLLNNDLIKAD
jgi:hypothetical protein